MYGPPRHAFACYEAIRSIAHCECADYVDKRDVPRPRA